MARFWKASPAVVATLLAGCATGGVQDGTPIVSRSGKPEAYFAMSPDKVTAKIASACMDRGGSVSDVTAVQVVCEMPIGAGQQLLAQMLIGNSYSTTPKEFIRFSAIPYGEGEARVQGYAWIETTMAFGQRRTVDLSGGRAGRQIEEMLVGIGGTQDPDDLQKPHGPII